MKMGGLKQFAGEGGASKSKVGTTVFAGRSFFLTGQNPEGPKLGGSGGGQVRVGQLNAQRSLTYWAENAGTEDC